MTVVSLTSAAVDTETPSPASYLASAFLMEASLVAYLTDRAPKVKVLLTSQP